ERVGLKVPKGSLHPAHVPLESETAAAAIYGMTNLRPGCRLLGDHHDAGTLAMDHFIQFPEERDRLQVLTAAKFISNPLAFFAAVIEIEHRVHGVDEQSFGMKSCEPEDRDFDQVILIID